MHQFYQSHQIPLARRATEPVTLAPTASMIDPNLENHHIQQSQINAAYGRPQIPNHHIIPNGFHPNHNASTERELPLREIDDNSIDDAYVQFIMYCNPSIRANVDTSELKKGFRTPPKSDGKTFSPYTLFGLISRLEAKDIKTWTQLVIELGVEQPDAAKNQSSQKVQQYAVRLKRWLHAFHVDAFFNYLHSKPTLYVEERPATEESLAETVRDGIPPEEDLAVRALLPQWRPKRGRRKAEDIEAEVEATAANKKLHTRSSSADFTSMFEEQYSTAPSSAMPWSAQAQQSDPWAAAQVAIAPKTPSTGQTSTPNQLSAQSMGQHTRWRFTSNETASSPYSQSAIAPRNGFSASLAFDEPRSAHPSTNSSKSPNRNRRRHGPAVSSAWPSTTSTTSGKLRGRPPSNRSVQDGPFSTFPVNPNAKETPAISVGTPTHTSPSPSRETPPSTQQSLTFNQQPAFGDLSQPRKPNKLQLQVPEHSGGPVRLATPPRVLINGESNRQASVNHERRSSVEFFNDLDEISEEDGEDDGNEEEENIDWKRRALTLKKRLLEKEEELRTIKRRVLDAVM
ncbi:hypothetical protein HO173_010510 [Letharia columbiana]|uniref:ARS binding protein Abp2 n=1 Tax=Letharia columbiana TaxID=112416 RepID=A0A8H6FMP7_9LECA|nr:uncharacterized protein HO173_010510 [Letharia columbiana]KAF6231367.1 hypothetical protein HO173_010510 [Letharia columbiana]